MFDSFFFCFFHFGQTKSKQSYQKTQVGNHTITDLGIFSGNFTLKPSHFFFFNLKIGEWS